MNITQVTENGLLYKVNTVDSGSKFWSLIETGERHREYGPAIEFSTGHSQWYLNGVLLYSDCGDETPDMNLIPKDMLSRILKHKLSLV